MTKQALKVLGTLLFLYGVFGYIFPKWGGVHFTNNENLVHVVTGILVILFSNASSKWRTIIAVIITIFYLSWGIWGFTLKQPLDAKILIKNKLNLSTQLDEVDNYAHIVTSLGFAWFFLSTRKFLKNKKTPK
jgi:hypothetical protein